MTTDKQDEPVIPEYKYELTEDPDNKHRWIVTEIRDKDTKIPLAAINQLRGGKSAGRWYVGQSHEQTYDRGMGVVERGFSMGNFADPQTAFDVVVGVRKLHLVEMALVPLPEDLRDWVTRQADGARDRITRAEAELFAAHAQARELHHFCDKYKLGTAEYMTRGCDIDAAVRDLVDFKVEGQEAPFFSETNLYELIGKDAARSLLGRLRRAVSLVSPSQSFLL